MILFLVIICLSTTLNWDVEGILKIRPKLVSQYVEYVSRHNIEPVPDFFLNTAELLAARGLIPEEYQVVTEDGYILTMFRATIQKSSELTRHTQCLQKCNEKYINFDGNKYQNNFGPPVLLLHGLSSTSEVWLTSKRNDSLPIMLADAGFDVWLGNLRGNALSRRHVTLNTNSRKYWDFSWHENGVYDIAAQLQKVAKVTGQRPTYIGYSLSATAFLAMAATRPDVAAEVELAVLLAPVLAVPSPGIRFPLGTLVYHLAPLLVGFLSKFTNGEITQRTPLIQIFLKTFCSGILQPLCLSLLNLGFGQSHEFVDKERLGFFTSTFPGGTSLRTLLHFAQIFKSGKFRQYDFGYKENLIRYNSTIPPDYDVSIIPTPMAIYYSDNDPFICPKAIKWLASELPNLLELHLLPQPYSHLDYMYSPVSKKVLFKPLLGLLNHYLMKTYTCERAQNTKDLIGLIEKGGNVYHQLPESLR